MELTCNCMNSLGLYAIILHPKSLSASHPRWSSVIEIMNIFRHDPSFSSFEPRTRQFLLRICTYDLCVVSLIHFALVPGFVAYVCMVGRRGCGLSSGQDERGIHKVPITGEHPPA